MEDPTLPKCPLQRGNYGPNRLRAKSACEILFEQVRSSGKREVLHDLSHHCDYPSWLHDPLQIVPKFHGEHMLWYPSSREAIVDDNIKCWKILFIVEFHSSTSLVHPVTSVLQENMVITGIFKAKVPSCRNVYCRIDLHNCSRYSVSDERIGGNTNAEPSGKRSNT